MKNAMAHSLLVGVLFLLLLFGGVTGSRAESFEAPGDENCFTSAQSDNDRHCINLPFGSIPALPGSESPGENENELEEELDFDEDDTESGDRNIETNIGRHCPHTLYLSYHWAFQNRAGVSLVILYHSWKSYLS